MKRPKKKDYNYVVRITEANQKRLTKLAKLDGRSESYIIDAALDMYLNSIRTQPLA
ncbi:hypothetical protein LCGC14_1651180 [marine sediment metagenome]|uniref:Ribbon-helix-helix protein CopG domain-containing protein n=1 Tax=marine sediment metagenome TaxID=412755 RepID=A0A0F9KX15_9ZZZZ